jgi:hypothetical protein
VPTQQDRAEEGSDELSEAPVWTAPPLDTSAQRLGVISALPAASSAARTRTREKLVVVTSKARADPIMARPTAT